MALHSPTPPKPKTKWIELTQPLRKSIQTGEGILVYVTNLILYLAALLPHGLSWTHAGLFLVILNSVHAFQRALLKAVALLSGAGLPPIAPTDVPVVPPQEEKAKPFDHEQEKAPLTQVQ